MIMFRASYFPIFLLLVFTAGLHIIGSRFYFYWDLWWYDIVLHLLGGMWIAATGFWMYYQSGWWREPKVSVINFFLCTFLCAFIVGIIWEILEYKMGLTFSLPGVDYQVDTAGDIGMDIVGGLLVYLYYRLTYWKIFIHHETN